MGSPTNSPHNFKLKNMEWNITYAKCNGSKTYKAFDIANGCFVGNIIYATSIENTDENRKKLQELADMNKHIKLSLQLRNNGKVVFHTV